MANFIYAKCKDAILKGQIDFNSNSIKVLIVDNTYSPNQVSHEFLSDVPVLSRLSSSSGLANKTINSGKFDASDITISNYARAIF
jgi:hypothetical protein